MKVNCKEEDHDEVIGKESDEKRLLSTVKLF